MHFSFSFPADADLHLQKSPENLFCILAVGWIFQHNFRVPLQPYHGQAFMNSRLYNAVGRRLSNQPFSTSKEKGVLFILCNLWAEPDLCNLQARRYASDSLVMNGVGVSPSFLICILLYLPFFFNSQCLSHIFFHHPVEGGTRHPK